MPRGSDQTDQVTTKFTNDVENARLMVTAKLNGGNDTVTADLSFGYDPASFGDLDLSLFGGAGNDTMIYNCSTSSRLTGRRRFPSPRRSASRTARPGS